MKKIEFIILTNSIFFESSSQIITTKESDNYRLTISPVVPEEFENISTKAREMLKNRLQTVIANQGIGNDSEDNQFYLVIKPELISEKIAPNIPAFYSYEYEISFFLVDAINRNVFSSTQISTKGGGNSERTAEISAFKNINAKDLSSLIETGKSKIIKYFEQNCNIFIKKARLFESRGEYEKALEQLSYVPEVCESCFSKVIEESTIMFNKQMKLECKNLLNRAKIGWSTDPSYEGAINAYQNLVLIPRASNCDTELDFLLAEIKKRLTVQEQRQFDLELKKWNDNVEIQKLYINAYKGVGEAYGNNQPQTITNFKGWLY